MTRAGTWAPLAGLAVMVAVEPGRVAARMVSVEPALGLLLVPEVRAVLVVGERGGHPRREGDDQRLGTGCGGDEDGAGGPHPTARPRRERPQRPDARRPPPPR